MGTILLLTMGTEGDLRPFLQIGGALRQRGHAVTLLTHAAYAERARGAGLGFAAIDTDAECARALADTQLANTPQGIKTLMQRHILPKLAPICELVRAHHRPGETVLFSHSIALLNAQSAAEYAGLPLGVLFMAPRQISSIPMVTALIQSAFGSELNRLRQPLGLPPVDDWQAWMHQPKPSVGQWPAWFGTPEASWPWEVTPVGSLLLDRGAPEPLPDAAQALLDPQRPPILITGGTGVFVEEDFFTACVAACQLIERTAILVSRHRTFVPASLPATVTWFPALPFATVLPHMAAAIHHGGMGTAGQCLAAGTPQLVLALGADRPDNGARLQGLGVAECLLRPHWHADTIAAALQRLIHTPAVQERCRSYAQRCGALDPTGATCQLIERLLAAQVPFSSPAPQRAAGAPTGHAPDPLRDSLRQRAEELSPQRRALLARLLQQRTAQARQGQRIAHLPRDAGANSFPLSFAQQRLWLHEQILPGSAAYSKLFGYRLSGRLDSDALAHSLRAVLQRHEILRTTFVERDGGPIQLVAPAAPEVLKHMDLQTRPADEQETWLRGFVDAEARRPFDLTAGPLLRAYLVQLGATDHLLFLCMHHIVCDGWSTAVLTRELAALYEARVGRRPAPLPPPPLQYADYAVWQRAQLQGAALRAQQDYWARRLANLPPVLDLPFAQPRPATATFHGARQALELPGPLAGALKELAQAERVTLFMLLLAAFKVLLHRYTGRSDVVVGSPIAGRQHLDLEPLIGFFLNMLVMRTDLAGQPSFLEVLRRVRETTLGAYAHQDVPFEQLVEALQPTRNLSHAPLFQVMFVLHNTPAEAFDLPGLQVAWWEVDAPSAQFDVTLAMGETAQGLYGAFEYNTALFDAPTIARMAGHFQTLLEGILADPGQPIGRLPLLTPAERQQHLLAWNQTRADYPRDGCLPQLIAAQAARRPTAPALVAGAVTLTYGELIAQANQLANHLRALGVGPETRVGICLDRTADLVVTALAILTAGGAYVPLDPAYPAERLAFIIADAALAVLVTHTALAGQLPRHNAQLLCLDQAAAVGRAPTTAPPGVPHPDQLAYVLYTSGSTGRPKGVMNTHGALLNLLRAMADQPGCTAQDTLLALTTLSFDIAALELWLPLLVGARLVLAPTAAQADGLVLRALLEQVQPTLLQATPATWQMLLALDWPGAPGMTLLCGGEALPPALAAQLRPRGRALWNLYGPTETTIWSAAHLVPAGADPVLIGRPISNTQFYILDAQLCPVPVGVPGELYIGGTGLARGYYGRPDLTAERFVPCPFAVAGAGQRLYRTGDLARYLPDGTIVCLGRIDHQIKLRGFRIELGEIERALSQHPAVHAAAATLYAPPADAAGETQLVAYAVLRAGQEDAAAGALRRWLQQRLPAYMVPAFVVLLDALPLTPNGKVDRRALPAPAPEQRAAEGAADSPRTPAEELLAAIWAQVLQLDVIGTHENFFELGGHSLLATQAIARVRDVFQVDLPVRALFEAPTIAGLASAVQAARSAGRAQCAQAAPVPRRDAQRAPLSFAQQRLCFLQQLEPASTLYTMPAALRITGALNLTALAQSLNAVVQRHEVLRTRFALAEHTPAQIIEPSLALPLPVHDLSGLAEPARDRALQERIAEEMAHPFPIERGPLIRASVIRLRPDEHVLLVAMHHAISDGWSVRILSHELAAFYQAAALGQPAPLPALPIQYADFALWQQQTLQGEQLEALLAYWRHQLQHAPPLLTLPTDRPRPAVQTFRGARMPVTLPAELAGALQRLSRALDASLFMTLLAAFDALLGWYAGATDVVVGTDIANRTRAETEHLIGFFVNQLVLRADLAGDPTFRELVARVRSVTLAAYDHQDLPFDMLVSALNPQRDASHAPLFQVKLVLHNQPPWATSIPGLTISPLELAAATAQLDLLLALEQTAEGLVGVAEYSTDLFDPATIAQLLGHFEALLQQAAAEPDLRLSALYAALDDRTRQAQRAQQRAFQEARAQRLKNARCKTISNTAT